MPDDKRATMNGKPVLEVPAKSIINFASGFEKKLLCDGLTFSTGGVADADETGGAFVRRGLEFYANVSPRLREALATFGVE